MILQALKSFTNPFPEFKQNRCKGNVTLFTYKKYIEPFSIPLMEREINEISDEIKNIKSYIDELSIKLIHDKNQQILQIQKIVIEKKNQIKKLFNYKTIIDQVRYQWKNDDFKKNLWAKYFKIIQTLYSTKSNESIRKFSIYMNQ